MTAPDADEGYTQPTGAARLAAELEDDARVARIRQAVHQAVELACAAEPDVRYGDVVDALTGVAYRYAQHLRRTDDVPLALPHDVELFHLGAGIGPDGLADWERRFREVAHQPAQVIAPAARYIPHGEDLTGRNCAGDTVECMIGVPTGLAPDVTVKVVDQHGHRITEGTTGPDGTITWVVPPAPTLQPASGVQISAVLPYTLGVTGVAALTAVAEVLARDARGDLVLVATDAEAGRFVAGAEVLITGNDDEIADGFVIAVRPAGEPAAQPEPDPDPDGPIAGGHCGRCGSTKHRSPACDADDFTAAAWLGRG